MSVIFYECLVMDFVLCMLCWIYFVCLSVLSFFVCVMRLMYVCVDGVVDDGEGMFG